MSIKSIAETVVRGMTAPILRHMDLRQWPSSASRIHDLATPRGITPRAARSADGPANINIILDLLDRVAEVPGSVAECGVYRGRTLVPLSLYVKIRQPGKHVFGMDSFEGFPANAINKEPPTMGCDPSNSATAFTNTSDALVLKKLHLFGLNYVQVYKGYFDNTLPRLSRQRFSFVHLDCDLYESYRQCLNFFYPRMNPGAILLLDEYNDPAWPGCNQAVDEFLVDKPERVEEIERQNYLKCFFVKQTDG